MRKTLLAIAAAAVQASPAMAMQGFSTCDSINTTVTSISGFDTRTAKMVAGHTRSDMLEFCHRDPRGAWDEAEEGGMGDRFININVCANVFMRNLKGATVTTWANCEKATLTVQYSPPLHVTRYKFPVIPSCDGDNKAAIAAFQTLCPSYQRNLETQQ